MRMTMKAAHIITTTASMHRASWYWSVTGVLIASAFLTDLSLGLVTTFAVAAHEIPHRVGDFAILVQAGLSRPRALLLNLATGLASPIGAVAAYYGLRGAMGALPSISPSRGSYRGCIGAPIRAPAPPRWFSSAPGLR